jgi:hypothetical protein
MVVFPMIAKQSKAKQSSQRFVSFRFVCFVVVEVGCWVI